MDVFFTIIVNVIFPVFALIAAGLVAHRRFHFDIGTLSKLTTYVLLPTVSFANIYESKVQWSLLLGVVGYLILLSISLIAIATVVSNIARFDKKHAAVFKNSVVLINSGNFGLPVSQLVFHDNPIGLSVQVVISVYQNMLTYSYGMMNSVSAMHEKSWKTVMEFLKIPTLYAVLLGLMMNTFAIRIPSFVWNPIDNVSDAFLAIALFTLGAQSAYLKINEIPLVLILSVLGRLIVSPVVSLLLILYLGLNGVIAQALFIASSFPTSRNASLLALEYDNHPEHAAKSVILTTMLSSITVSIVVYLSQILFH
ncbi:AEC family transporter [Paenibacillus allorhizosphaerae]|uniref:AEC family transporter n=1 Tax=Paenibacillus allorhizosphaerae TaxID=2849866 RepID=A0ABN7TL51_9BACL|nr:AEC family transporter [Paenibacillus allorhizosphaerae]CAG7645040.1 hypothetical protein PAECIP111802_03415 [Paenibacillus allorhizosphaerae]